MSLANPVTEAIIGSTNAASDATMTTVAAHFLAHCRVDKLLSANTLRAYRSDLADFLSHLAGARRPADVDRDTVRRYAQTLLEGKRLKESTVRRRMATLRVLFRWMEREALVPLNVFHRLDLSIRLPRRLPRALNQEEMRGLLYHARVETRQIILGMPFDALLTHFIVVILFITGLRVGELVTVRLGDMSLAEGFIQVRGKGNRERRVYLPGREAQAIVGRYLRARRRVMTPTDRLLVRANGVAVSPQYVRLRLRALARRAGVSRRVTPHMIRHTAATELLSAGVDIRFVQRLLGHASIVTTQIYTEVCDEALKSRLTQANTLSRLSRAG